MPSGVVGTGEVGLAEFLGELAEGFAVGGEFFVELLQAAFVVGAAVHDDRAVFGSVEGDRGLGDFVAGARALGGGIFAERENSDLRPFAGFESGVDGAPLLLVNGGQARDEELAVRFDRDQVLFGDEGRVGDVDVGLRVRGRVSSSGSRCG